MKLALFTPAAALWPVLRNFDVFIASLAAPRADAERIAESALYPLRATGIESMPGGALELRLHELHRELYTALLRPSEVFASDTRSIAEAFWPDLRGTSIAALLEAFCYYFLRKVEGDVTVSDGLSVLRAVFFNHSATDPSLWIYSAEQRLAALRLDFPTCRVELPAPLDSRLQDLVFVINARAGAPPAGTGWVWGSLRRRPDGQVIATAECGIDPSVLGTEREAAACAALRRELCVTLDQVFGWQRVEAAA